MKYATFCKLNLASCCQPPQKHSMPSIYRSSLAKRIRSGGGVPDSGAPASGGGISGRVLYLVAYSRFGLKFFPFFFLHFLAIILVPSSAFSLYRLSSGLSILAHRNSAAQRRAVVAVLCGAAPCCVRTRYHTKVPGTRVCTYKHRITKNAHPFSSV